jgi:hypothetical protein
MNSSGFRSECVSLRAVRAPRRSQSLTGSQPVRLRLPESPEAFNIARVAGKQEPRMTDPACLLTEWVSLTGRCNRRAAPGRVVRV